MAMLLLFVVVCALLCVAEFLAAVKKFLGV
jgi:hypothetical protein